MVTDTMSDRPALSCVTVTRNWVLEVRLALTVAPRWAPFTCHVTLPAFLGSVNVYVTCVLPRESSHFSTRSVRRPAVAEHEPVDVLELVWTPSRVWPVCCLGAKPADAGAAPSRAMTRTRGALNRNKGATEGSVTDGVSSSLFAEVPGVPRTGQNTRLAAQKRLVLDPVWLVGLGT